MCEFRTTQQTQLIVERESDCDNDADMKEEVDASIWGRLLPIGSVFQPVDLRKDVTTFGRKDDCDVNLNTIVNMHCQPTAYSNLHFKIKREYSVKTGSHALLEDSSSNGTFINGEKLGKGRVEALKNNCEISLAKKENKAFIFIDLSSKDDKWPAEVKEKYTITKTLGKGAFGEVRLAFEKHTCNKYAIKIISKRKFTLNGKHQITSNNSIMTEVEILKKLEHPCIIKIKEVIDTKDTVFIVLDLVEGGELFDKVVKLGQYDEPTAKLLFYQMVLAIKYLHDQGISHRDLKPENILLSSEDKNETLIKVTDFGMSKFFDTTSMMKTFCGTPNYLAPEVISTKGEASYTNKIDNWSLGVILYICLVGYPPFSDEGSVKLEDQIKNGVYEFPDEFWSDVSENAKDLIRKLLCVDPEKRISLDEALEHDWIKKDFEMKRKAYKLMYKDEENLVLNGSKKRKESPEKRSQDSDDNNYKKRLRPSNSNTTDKSND